MHNYKHIRERRERERKREGWREGGMVGGRCGGGYQHYIKKKKKKIEAKSMNLSVGFESSR